MSKITASMVNDLRKKTGAGIMACKNALVETSGNEEEAIQVLRKKGESKAADKSGRDTSEGKIFILKEGNKAVSVKISCETDFVANNEKIKEFGEKVGKNALANGEEKGKNEGDEEIKQLIGTIGENLKLEEVKVIESENIGTYVHLNGKIGVITSLKGGNEEVANDISMHIAAMNPEYLSPSEVSEGDLAKEVDVWKEELKGKPENIIGNIMKGKEKKFREGKALKTQAFAKDPSMTCEEYVKSNSGEITAFFRTSL